jgi:hypothetical protein
MRYPMERRDEACRGDSAPADGTDQRRAIGSAGERLVHTEEVTGSIPVSPTKLSGRFRPRDRPFLDLGPAANCSETMRFATECIL